MDSAENWTGIKNANKLEEDFQEMQSELIS